jgi:hypothetical protein
MPDSSDLEPQGASDSAAESGNPDDRQPADPQQASDQPESSQPFSGPPRYGESPYGQPPYGQTPYGQPPYGQTPYGQTPYGQSPYGQAPYGQAPYGQAGYVPGAYPPSPYGASPYGQWVPPAPKPGIIPLRPLSVGEILDGAFTAVRRNPKATLGLAAIVMTVYGVVTAGSTLILVHLARAASQNQTLTAARFVEIVVPTYAIVVVVAFLADAILTGMLTAVVGHGVLGRQISIGDAWRIAWPRFWALVGSTLLEGLVLFLTLLVGIGVSAGIGAALIAGHVAPVGILIIVIGVLTTLVFTVIFAVRFAVAAPTVVLEDRRPAASLRRSWSLIRKSSWRVFGIILLTEVIVFVATGVLEVPFGVIGAIVGHGSGGTITFGGASTTANDSVAATIISAIGGIVAGSVTRPVLAGTRVLLYVDLRMRREGLDIALQAASGQPGQPTTEFGSVWAGQPTPAGQPGQPGQPDPGPTPGQAPPPDQPRW